MTKWKEYWVTQVRAAFTNSLHEYLFGSDSTLDCSLNFDKIFYRITLLFLSFFFFDGYWKLGMQGRLRTRSSPTRTTGGVLISTCNHIINSWSTIDCLRAHNTMLVAGVWPEKFRSSSTINVSNVGAHSLAGVKVLVWRYRENRRRRGK